MYLESDVEACQGLHVRKRDGLLAEIGDRDSYFEIFSCPFDVRKNKWSVVETITMSARGAGTRKDAFDRPGIRTAASAYPTGNLRSERHSEDDN
eukprot:scaffold368_cov127-Isochrysis_galbana.AAC.3